MKQIEHKHQCALMSWANRSQSSMPELKWLYAIPNGGQRNKIVAAKLKLEGVKAGVSDLFLPAARHGFNGMYIELKAPKGRATENQKEFIADMLEAGYHAGVYHGWEAAKESIEWYLS